jgi:hypothetical protein
MMITRYFTLEEANALLVEIRPLMRQLLERRAKVARMRDQIVLLVQDYHLDVGGAVASELTIDFITIEYLTDKIQSYGCVIKDLNGGLLDFLTERNGREVYLCWRYGEDRIEYYHELHTGYNGRQHV